MDRFSWMVSSHRDRAAHGVRPDPFAAQAPAQEFAPGGRHSASELGELGSWLPAVRVLRF